MEEMLRAAVSSTNLFGNSAELLQKVLDTIPQRVFWKNRDLVYLGCNQLFANDVGLDSPQDIFGLTDLDLPWSEEKAESLRQSDRKLIDAGEAEIGVVESQSTGPGKCNWLEINRVPLHDDEGNVTGILGTYHDITKQKQAEQALKEANEDLEKRVTERTRKLRFLAQHDSLTGLVNRSYFVQQLDQLIDNQASENRFALLFIDLDRFKPINDTEGHEAGDQLLIQVSEILSSTTQADDVVGRFGGDEFMVLLKDVESRCRAGEVCEEIQRQLQTLVHIDGRHVPMSASIGIAFNDAEKYGSAEEILRDADVAMYVAKTNMDQKSRVFNREMLHQATRKRALENEIQAGIANHEFVLHYQPIINVKDHRLAGFEALVRWQHPVRGLVPPYEFISVAEETGSIVELGEFILREACNQLGQWWQSFPHWENRLSVNVNVSARQLNRASFLPKARSILAEAGLSRGAVKFEITESLLLQDSESAVRVLNQLRTAGFDVVLDDFGTGYSSLSYLDQLPVDVLKIDRSFIRKMDPTAGSDAIIRMILALAKTLDVSVVAEGVESAEQLQQLTDMECDLVQGFYFAKPMDAENATRYLLTKDPTAENFPPDVVPISDPAYQPID
jgi:diguanylate cyclase (GGDEF)-like protein/PAS domain S-box-containing protein